MSSPSVSILLCTYNGEEYLSEQLNSLAQQTHENWVLYISDDGSKDATLQIINDFSKTIKQKIIVKAGEKKGFARNFLSLAEDKAIKTDYYCFCDQDDIWLPEKIEIALKRLAKEDNSKALAYFSATKLINENQELIGDSEARVKPPSFKNALVQSLASGNTAVFNQKTKDLFEQTKGASIPAHDWWLYILVTAVEGRVIYDKNAYILYRQHTQNVIGHKSGVSLLKMRVKRFISNDFKKLADQNLEALSLNQNLIAPRQRDSLTGFITCRNLSFFKRITQFYKIKLYRQTTMSHIMLWVLIILKKI